MELAFDLMSSDRILMIIVGLLIISVNIGLDSRYYLISSPRHLDLINVCFLFSILVGRYSLVGPVTLVSQLGRIGPAF